MQSTLTLEQRDERDAEQRAEFLKRPGSIAPQAKAKQPYPPEFYHLNRRIARLNKALGIASGDTDRHSFWRGDGWTAKGQVQALIFGPAQSQVYRQIGKDARRARELAKQVKIAPIPAERALMIIPSQSSALAVIS